MRTKLWLCIALAFAPITVSARSPGDHPATPPPAVKPNHQEKLLEAKTPPFTEGIFPCSECHKGDFNPTRRELGFHDDIQSEFHHDSENRWCLDCHDAKNRDQLHLTSGVLLPFTESYKLCGQCHGDKYRDWKKGVHGKRIGEWNGAKTYFLCVNCHNPHSPRFKPLKPLPKPVRPSEMKR